MTFYVSSGLYSFIANLLIAIFVYKRNPQNKLNILFAVFSLTVSGWSFGSFLVNVIPDKAIALNVLRLNYLFAVFLPSTYVHFAYELANVHTKSSKIKLRACYLVSMILTPLVFTKFFISELHIIPDTTFYISSPGVGYYAFFTFFAFGMYEVLAQTIFKVNSFAGRKQDQIKYMTIANAIAIFAGFEYFTRVFSLIDGPPLDDYILVAYLLVVAYSIVAHKLFEIEVIVKKTLVFAGMFGMAMLVVSSVTTLMKSYIRKLVDVTPEFGTLVSIMIVLLFYDPVRNLLVRVTDKFLFQKKFKLTQIVSEGSEAIAFVRSLKWLSRRIVSFLVIKCRINNALVYVRSREDHDFRVGALRGYVSRKTIPKTLYENDLMVSYLNNQRRPVELHRLEQELVTSDAGSIQTQTLEKVLTFLRNVNGEVLIPSFLRRRIDTDDAGKDDHRDEVSLRSILVLGGKKSDESYSDEELEIFHTLAQESAISIENARLYDEAIQRTHELAKINDDLENANEKLRVTQASLIVAEKNATMVGMAKAIGHEVNNPLTTIMTRANNIHKKKLQKLKDLYEGYKSSIAPQDVEKMDSLFAEIEDDGKRVSRGAHRINAVIHSLTDILRNTKGEMRPLSVKVLITEAIQATGLSTYEENLAGCDIVEDLEPNLTIHGNAEQLLQVFINMIKNAYEAMEGVKDRKITIRADTDPDNNQFALIEFEDNGPGIPDEVLTKMWGQGFSTKDKKDESIGAAGQGQGLFVCKHMVESVHKGSIEAVSPHGQGAIFKIRIPLAD